jgi:hypothetical protein
MLVAFDELRELVRAYIDDPAPLCQRDKWTALLDEMTVDANLTPDEAQEREKARTARVEERREADANQSKGSQDVSQAQE